MAGFLTEEWIDALDAVARTSTVPEDLELVVQQIVTGDGDEVAYVLEASGGHLRARSGRAEDADVTFTQDRATATAIARGELSAQAAFMDGRLRLGGDLRSILARASDLAALDDVFATARAETTW